MTDPATNETDPSTPAIETRGIHAGHVPDAETGAIMPPIYASSTFVQDAPGEHRGYEYSRTDNPTRSVLEANVASLEAGSSGRAFASGMAAISTVLHLLETGDQVLVGEDVYGGTYRLFNEVYDAYGLEFEFIDLTDPHAVVEAMTPETELVWVETPTNPLLHIVDIESIADIAHDNEALCVVDNTFATPYLQRPLEYGADIVAHSLTKYLGGHSDVVGGALITDDPALDEKLGFYQNSVGGILSPFESFLVLRGIKTLGPRMDRHCQNAHEIAHWLNDNDAVAEVYYPGLHTHEQHALAATQMDDFGGMVSFELDASLEATRDVVSSTDVFALAESLGGVESLIEQPATMTHASIPSTVRRDAGLTDGLVRLSIGIEHVDDLIADLDTAIASVL